MAYLDHKEANDSFRDQVAEGIGSHFPIEGKLQTLHLERLEVRDEDLHSDDIRKQHQVKVQGGTLSAPVYAHLKLKNNVTGAVVDQKKVRLAEVPVMTSRYSHIIDGKEYQVDNQWQLKPGVYTRRRQTGELETQFNIANKPEFKVLFDPKKKQFTMQRGKSKIPMYPLMKAMGVSDQQLEKSWGKDILESNKKARGVATALDKFYKADRRTAPPDAEAAKDHFVKTMKESELRADSTQVTLGKAFTGVSGEVFQKATAKILRVQAGASEDDRDSLEFKDLRTVGDYARDKLQDWRTKRSVRTRAMRKINSTSNIRDLVKFDSFNRPIRDVFQSAAARLPDQVNPVEMISASQQTTLLGPGGIQSEQKIIDEAKFINPSHLGFLDPIHTPESAKTGVTLRLPMGVKKVGKEPKMPLYNIKSGKTEYVSPVEFRRANVVLPDQVTWKNGKPTPIDPTVKMSGRGNEMEESSFRGADYVMKHPSQVFNLTTNLIPFLGNTSGVRARAATSHIEQAIALEMREAPLVQTSTGTEKEGIRTFEELLGRRVAGHAAPVTGKIESVTDDAIIIKDRSGKTHEVQLYNNFPLNDPKAVMHSTAAVKPGQRVSRGDLVADTNFTKDGVLALGTNLRVAYLPYKGYNFEDGVVISESAAKKLSSLHMKKPSVRLDEGSIGNPKRFQVQHPEVFGRDQYKMLSADGVVKVGQTVRSGDPLVLSTKPFKIGDRFDIRSIRKSAAGHHTDTSLKWDSDQPGEVVAVHKKGQDVTVHVRTIEPMKVGDKIAGRYGNKGIVAKVERDDEMPQTADGQHIQVALNPSGVPGRMNIGQVLETAAAKIAIKTGKPYIVDNFGTKVDQLAKVKSDLKKHGISDTEVLIDPVTGVNLGKALVGHQHMLKLTHQIDKKSSVRSGMSIPGEESEGYDLNLMPAHGGKTGGMSMGALGMYTMLAHGAKANIREMQTFKSEGPDDSGKWPSQHRDVWARIQTGEPLPTPKPTFTYRRFEHMLRAAGINIEKKGHNLQLSPLTDKQILSMSSGELPKPAEITYAKLDDKGDPKPKKGGLFDPKITGGHGGTKWSHIKLAEPVPNPVFEGAIQKLTGLSKKDYNAIVSGERAINRTGMLVDLGTVNATTGGQGIKNLLDKIDVDKMLPKMEAELTAARMPKTFATGVATQKLDQTLKKVKYLRALKETGLQPSEAYVLHNLPVIPPAMRPASVLPDGSVKWEDLNGLYSKFAQINDKLKDPVLVKNLTDDNPTKKAMRADLYDGVKAITGVGSLKGDDIEERGVLHQIHGVQPKKGYFQKTMMNRRQDMSMRSVIVPEPALGLDEVGLPKDKAMKLYRPFVVRKMVEIGAASNPLEAQKLIDKKDKSSVTALGMVSSERPVLLKRDPALHKYSVQAFRPRLVTGNAIQIHPLVTSGFNADFDGDAMSVYVPISREAVDEAKKMFPTNNLFSEASGRVMYQPTLESALGLYKLSRVSGDSGKRFKDQADVLKAMKSGKVGADHLVTIGRKKTTPGRILLTMALPQVMHKAILEDHDTLLDKKGIEKLFTTLAKDHKDEFGNAANKLKDLGNGMAYGSVAVAHPAHKGPAAIVAAERSKKSRVFLATGTHSLSLADFEPDRAVRDPVLRAAQKRVDLIRGSKLTKDEKDRRSNKVWGEASDVIKKEHIRRASKKPSNLFIMQQAGVKPGWDQYKQLVLAPIQVTNPRGDLVPLPIKKSYAEGLDLGEYWTQSHGARHGIVMKVQEVQEPGVFSKQLINTSMGMVVGDPDCGTTRGTALPIGGTDVFDRTLVRGFKAKGVNVPAGTVLQSDIVDSIRSADKNAQVIVRSPLKCEHGTGLCQQCAGVGSSGKLYDLGTNLGIIAAQSLGERATQLTLKAFHSGGVASKGKAKVINNFKRIQQLTSLPENIPDSAELAMQSGLIEKIEQDPTGARLWIGGKEHFIGRDRDGKALHKYLPGVSDSTAGSWKPPKVGMKFERGQSLSDPARTMINPRHLYAATGSMEKVQNHLVKELHDIYKEQGVKRQHVETVVKAMSNLTRVRDPGDAEFLLRGEFRPMSSLRSENTRLLKAGKRPAEHEPVLKGIDVMPLAVQEDWMAKLMHNRLRDTIMDAAATAAVSNLHGPHPIPGMAYGAEFGLTKRHALQPGLKHLADVPVHSY